MQAIQKTFLHDWHVTHGANMADFGGYHMPLWYPSGAKNEHLSVLTHAGIFDTSHMAIVMVQGANASDLFQTCFTRDLNACLGKKRTPLEAGNAVYGVFLNEDGYLIDDAILYQFASDDYMIVINAGMGNTIAQHLIANVRNSWNVKVTDMSNQIGKIDIQGLLSAKVLFQILAEPEKVLGDMRYFIFKGYFDKNSRFADTVRLTDGTLILLSRTGYTGEFGFEIFVAPEHTIPLWERILDIGKDLGIMPCGLAARDSLRTGAMLPLSHQDIGSWRFINTPWDFALPYHPDKKGFTKSFIGDKALLSNNESEYTYAFVGYDLRKVSAPDSAVFLDSEEKSIGIVLTCVSDMGIGRHGEQIYSIASPDKPEDFVPKGLSCGFIKVNRKLNPGHKVILRDKRRSINVVIADDIRPDRTARHPIRDVIGN